MFQFPVPLLLLGGFPVVFPLCYPSNFRYEFVIFPDIFLDNVFSKINGCTALGKSNCGLPVLGCKLECYNIFKAS